jgi:uncharacterized protein (TIGR02186 family)
MRACASFLWSLIRSALVAAMWVMSFTMAYAETLVTSLSSREVEITSTYTGAKLKVYGVYEIIEKYVRNAQPKDYVIVVTVLGPTHHFTVRQKGKVGPAWFNRSTQVFKDVPSFVAVLSSKPIAETTNLETARNLFLGLDLNITPNHLLIEMSEKRKEFREAMIRLGQQEGRYQQDENAVFFMKIKDKKGKTTGASSSLFEANIQLPATVMTGTYTVQVGLFAEGVLLDKSIDYFEVKKTGFEATIVNWVQDHSWSYGVAMCLMALFFGWLASMIFRRD